MKKAILTFGLFSLVVLTSFTVENQVSNADSGGSGSGEPVRTGGVNTDLGGGASGAGNDGNGGTKKLDYTATSVANN